MIGANGSGKSTFSRFLKKVLYTNISVIPSQQLLYYEIPNLMKPGDNHIEQVQNFQKKDKLGNTNDIKAEVQNDFTNLIFALNEERDIIKEKSYRAKNYLDESIFDKVVAIWKEFIPNKTIEINKYNLDIIDNRTNEPYPINNLSDGEKAIFYYTAHILFAKKDAYIIIDEPENHLHTALCDKLWNKLEEVRPDCKFIYLTHNLDFAVSRNNKTILWNKSFIPPRDWDVEILPNDDNIPQRLLAEIVGSKKTILFCEGEDKSSIDFRLYNSIFPEYTVVPVGTRKNVINSVIACNKNPYINGHSAVGIVDRDEFYTEIDKLKENKIYTLITNEIENILCDEKLLKIFLDQFCSPNKIEKIKNAFFKKLKERKETLIANYVADFISQTLQNSIIKNRNNIQLIANEYRSLKNIDIEKLRKQKDQELTKYIEDKNYDDAVKVVNFKKELTCEICNKYVVNDFEERVLDLINKDCELQTLIRNMYFPSISN